MVSMFLKLTDAHTGQPKLINLTQVCEIFQSATIEGATLVFADSYFLQVAETPAELELVLFPGKRADN